MDRYFYSVELDDNGNKQIHMYCNVYMNDVDETENNYRNAEWTFLYITLTELKDLIEDDVFFEYVNEKVSYLLDITDDEAYTMCNEYFYGNPGVSLHIKNVTEETACGDYWFDI